MNINITSYRLLRQSIVKLILELKKINNKRFDSAINDMLPGLDEMARELESCYNKIKEAFDKTNGDNQHIELNSENFESLEDFNEFDKALDFMESSLSVLRKTLKNMIFIFENKIQTNEDKKLFKKTIFSLKDVEKILLNAMRISSQTKELLNEN